QHLPQLDLVGDVLPLALLVEPRLDLGEVEERAVRPASRRCREIVVPPPPVRDGGARDARDTGDLGTAHQRVRRGGRGLWHTGNRTQMPPSTGNNRAALTTSTGTSAHDHPGRPLSTLFDFQQK